MLYLVTKDGVSYIVNSRQTAEFKAKGYAVSKLGTDKEKQPKKANKQK